MPSSADALASPLSNCAVGVPDDASFNHHQTARGDARRILHAVRHHEQRRAFLLAQFFQQRQHLLTQRRIERGKRLIQQQNGALSHQTARQRRPLTLAAGERARQPLQQIANRHVVGYRLDLTLLLRVQPQAGRQPERNVLAHRQMVKEIIFLKQHRHRAF